MKFELSVEPIWKREALAVMRGALAAAAVAASCWISSLRSSTSEPLLLILDFAPQIRVLSPAAGASCASAAPAKGSSAAMDAPAAARLIFTLVLLDSCVPQGQESVGMWGLCRQSRPGNARGYGPSPFGYSHMNDTRRVNARAAQAAYSARRRAVRPLSPSGTTLPPAPSAANSSLRSLTRLRRRLAFAAAAPRPGKPRRRGLRAAAAAH